MASSKPHEGLIATSSRFVAFVFQNVIVRYFTLPSLFMIASMYVLAVEIPYDVLGVNDENANIFGQTGNYILAEDDHWYDSQLPYLLFLVLTIVALIESTIYGMFFREKLSFAKFLYAYRSLLYLAIPVWSVFIALISMSAQPLLVVPWAVVGLLFFWPLINAELALNVFLMKLVPDEHHKEKLNQKARAPWTAVKDLWR